MTLKDDDLHELLTIFKSESEEHLQKLNDGILALEKEPAKRELIEEIFREAHSLKGAARMIGFEQVEKIAHAVEDIFNEARKEKLALTGRISDFVLKGLDLINTIISIKLQGKGNGVIDIDGYLRRQADIMSGQAVPEAPRSEPAAIEPHAAQAPPTAPAMERRSGARGAAPAVERRKAPVETILSHPPTEDEEGISVNVGGRDQISRGIQDVEDKIRARKKTGEPSDISTHLEETIRVSIDKLDELMAHVGEILVTKIRSDQKLAEAREFLQLFGAFQKSWHNQLRRLTAHSALRENRERLITEFVAATTGTIDDLTDRALRLADGMAEENLRLELISGSIQESVNRVRMLPMSAVFNFFPRLVRDIAREQGKEVELIVKGADTRLDKRILEELKDPLTHLVRNSIDHGLELPDDRLAAGKPRTGRLLLAAYQKGNNVLVELEDDGQGIDPEKIKEVALKRGFISPEALAEMSHGQIIQIVFQPGFSTKNIITDVSGRGVGLDVVLTNIERLKGKISTTSAIGKGTRFSIKLPLTLATTQALLIVAAGQRFALPLTAVEYTGEVDLDEISTVEGKETVLIGGQPISLTRLAEVLELPEPSNPVEEGNRVPLVILSSADDRIAFAVDGFVGEQEIVVKNMGSHFVRVPNVAGATLMADGTPVMILNVFDLIKNARKARGLWVPERKKPKEKGKRVIMVVDDSITTRTLEKNILEASGYAVVTAVDGVEAVEKLKSKKVDLVVTDIQMPRLDGFDLTAAIKRDKNWQRYPVILVTSLESEEDKKRGIEVGADAYITKGAFDQGNLLTTIKQLL